MIMINLTPHPVTIFDGDRVIVTQPPDGTMARCTETRAELGTLVIYGNKVPLREVAFGDVEGLPEPADGVVVVVSRAAAEAAAARYPERDDIVYPDGQVRDEQGRIIGCTGLARVPRPLVA